MNFESEFYAWLNVSLAERIPENVVGFSFNLYETGSGFGVELIGASAFDENDPDWPCEEIFEPKQRRLDIPSEFSGGGWEQCLENMRALAFKYINSNEPGSVVLANAKGVGIGFVDGDLTLLKKP